MNIRLQRAEPIGAQHVDGLDAQSVKLRIFHQSGRAVDAHRLIVQYGRRERRKIMALEIGAGVGNERKAGGVRSGNPYSANDRMDWTICLRLRENAVVFHALAQLHFQFPHPRPRAAHSHRPAQFLRLAAAEVGDDH